MINYFEKKKECKNGYSFQTKKIDNENRIKKKYE